MMGIEPFWISRSPSRWHGKAIDKPTNDGAIEYSIFSVHMFPLTAYVPATPTRLLGFVLGARGALPLNLSENALQDWITGTLALGRAGVNRGYFSSAASGGDERGDIPEGDRCAFLRVLVGRERGAVRAERDRLFLEAGHGHRL